MSIVLKKRRIRSVAGSLDMAELMQALVDVGYEGVIRPDHGRAIWDEKSDAWLWFI